jgi:uncharacterized protein (TIGR02284 family)
MTLPADATFQILNRLIANCREDELGFRRIAEHSKSDDIRALLKRRAEELRADSHELEAHLSRLGGKPAAKSHDPSALRQGWVEADATLASWSDLNLIEACERSEDLALERFSDALAQPLEPSIKHVLDMQRMGVKRNHDQIRAMRDRLRALA